MVEHQLITPKAIVESLPTHRSPWARLFEDLINGETAYIYGSREELPNIRRRIHSAYHFRKRTYPGFPITINTKIGLVNNKTALIISGVKV